MSRQEGGKIFGSGARTPVAITLLVKNPAKTSPCVLRYHDIGDYLTREEKLDIINRFGGIAGIERAKGWRFLTPNADQDWINQRDPRFGKFIAVGDKSDADSVRVFETYSLGVATGRDSWAYNMSRSRLQQSITGLIAAYTSEQAKYKQACEGLTRGEWPAIEEVVDLDPKRISWTRALKGDAAKGKPFQFKPNAMVEAMYRPFTKQWMYFDRQLNEMVYQQHRLFPTPAHANVAICMTAVGNRNDFSAIVTDTLPDLHMSDKSGGSQCFPLYLYERGTTSGSWSTEAARWSTATAGGTRSRTRS